jgi:hypothetical protein
VGKVFSIVPESGKVPLAVGPIEPPRWRLLHFVVSKSSAKKNIFGPRCICFEQLCFGTRVLSLISRIYLFKARGTWSYDKGKLTVSFFFQNINLYPAGFELTNQSSNLLGGRRTQHITKIHYVVCFYWRTDRTCNWCVRWKNFVKRSLEKFRETCCVLKTVPNT